MEYLAHVHKQNGPCMYFPCMYLQPICGQRAVPDADAGEVEKPYGADQYGNSNYFFGVDHIQSGLPKLTDSPYCYTVLQLWN